MRISGEGQNPVDDRPKNFLNEGEIADFLKSARQGRHGVRNYAMVLLAFRHGLRVSELIDIRMSDVDLDTGRLFVRRLKRSLSTSQPLEGDEIRASRAWLRQRVNAPCCNSPLVFLPEREPMTRQALNYICAEVGKRAKLPIKVHPHVLRHSTGFALANKGRDTRLIQDLLGHRNISHTTCAHFLDLRGLLFHDCGQSLDCVLPLHCLGNSSCDETDSSMIRATKI